MSKELAPAFSTCFGKQFRPLFIALALVLSSYAGDFQWKPRVDLPIIGGSLLASYLALNEFQKLQPADTGRLYRGELPVYDRWAAGLYSGKADLASDILCAGVLVPLALSGVEAHRSGKGMVLLLDFLMLSEALALSSALNLWTRSLGNRPRPLVHSSRAPREERLRNDASSSFYSGHASAAFVTAVYTSYVFQARHPNAKVNRWIWPSTLSAAGLVAGLRVMSGKHYPSDVVSGACIGSLFGFLVPWLHYHHSSPGKLSLRPDISGIGFSYRF